jgi:putative ABC transport system permease protein
LLAAIGLYGMLAFSVAQRSREMGIRIALGARPAAVFRLVIGQGMLLVGVGVLLGIAGALAATRLLAARLFDVGPTDPAVFTRVAIRLTLAGLAACVIPARRATRADAIAALRLQ